MPTDSKTAEIVATLRAFAASFYRCFGPSNGEHDTLVSAADLLEANAREIERLEKERDGAIRQLAEEGRKRGKAEAERDKLREGLRPFLPISIHNTQDYAEVSFGNHQTQAMTVQPDDWRRLNDLFTAASGAQQGGEDHQLRPVEPAVDRGPQVTSALPGACAEKVAGARIDALEEAAKAMETTRDFGDTNVANAVRVVAARAIRKLKETGNGS